MQFASRADPDRIELLARAEEQATDLGGLSHSWVTHHKSMERRSAKTPAQFHAEMADAIYAASVPVLIAVKRVEVLLRLQRLLQQSISDLRQSACGTQQRRVRHDDQYRAARPNFAKL